MSTIANLEVEQLKQHLISGGFLAVFTDIFANPQPAPITQELEVDFTSVKPDDRVIMIRTTGNISNPSTRTFFKERMMLVMVAGKVGEADSVIAGGLAEDMENYLMANPTDNGCIFDISSRGVNGPLISDDSRRVYEINISVSFNISRPLFS